MRQNYLAGQKKRKTMHSNVILVGSDNKVSKM